MSSAVIHEGDCIERMRELDESSIDSVVTDPPYGIGFMGHEWDQPGEFGPVGANGEPVPMQAGRRGKSQPRPETGAGHARDRKRKHHAIDGGKREGVKSFGGPTGVDNTTHSLRGGAMHAGRYDLSSTANQRFQAWCEAWASEAFRVLKPGGHLLAFGGTRTFHRLTSGLEDAGFEIRDGFLWLYGSGFPKSRDVGDALTAEADREARAWFTLPHGPRKAEARRKAALAEGKRWQAAADEHDGEGTALKPSWEPVVIARKPFAGSVARNVREHGTGGIGVDRCRLGTSKAVPTSPRRAAQGSAYGDLSKSRGNESGFDPNVGRWPANVGLTHTEDCVQVGHVAVASDGHFPAQRGPSGFGAADGSNAGGLHGQRDLAERHFAGELVERWACVPGCPVRMLDDQTGTLTSGGGELRRNADKFRNAYGAFAGSDEPADVLYGDSGGASRFFYCGKASRAERNAGLDGFEIRVADPYGEHRGRRMENKSRIDGKPPKEAQNVHPTVKPVDLMRWLVRLVTPPGGVVLDPFTGSGTTGIAAVLEGYDFVGIERYPEYIAIAEARIAFWREHPEGLPIERGLAAERKRRAVAKTGQLSLEAA